MAITKDVHIEIKNHNNTVSAKNNIMTSILTLCKIDKNTINVDDDLNDLLDDLLHIVNELKEVSQND